MRQVTLEFKCPVYVVVDLDVGEVVQVVVDDTADTEWHPDTFDWEGEAVDDEAARQAAIEVAKHADWPEWDFGW